jgi:hypothetical protein
MQRHPDTSLMLILMGFNGVLLNRGELQGLMLLLLKTALMMHA